MVASGVALGVVVGGVTLGAVFSFPFSFSHAVSFSPCFRWYYSLLSPRAVAVCSGVSWSEDLRSFGAYDHV